MSCGVMMCVVRAVGGLCCLRVVECCVLRVVLFVAVGCGVLLPVVVCCKLPLYVGV